MLIRAVRFAYEHPFITGAVILGGPAAWFLARELMGLPTPVLGGLQRDPRAAGEPANNGEASLLLQPALNSNEDLNDLNDLSEEEEEDISELERSIPMDLNAILRAAGHFEAPEALPLEVSWSFNGAECEESVLSTLFEEEGLNEEVLVNDRGHEGATNEVPDEARSTNSPLEPSGPSNNYHDRLLWRSQIPGTNFVQMRLNEEEFTTAVGLAYENTGNCISNFAVDTSPTQRNQQERSAREESEARMHSVDEAFSAGAPRCFELPNQELQGYDHNGERVFNAGLSHCSSAHSSPLEERVNSSPAPSTWAPPSTQNNTSRAPTSEEGLMQLIQEIRAQFCSDNITLLTDVPENTHGTQNTQTTPVSRETTQIMFEIQRLCPNLTVYQLPAGDPNYGLTLPSLVRGLDRFARNITSDDLILVDSHPHPEDVRDTRQLDQLLDTLNQMGVSVFSSDGNSWVNDARLMTRHSGISDIVSRSSAAARRRRDVTSSENDTAAPNTTRPFNSTGFDNSTSPFNVTGFDNSTNPFNATSFDNSTNPLNTKTFEN